MIASIILTDLFVVLTPILFFYFIARLIKYRTNRKLNQQQINKVIEARIQYLEQSNAPYSKAAIAQLQLLLDQVNLKR